ncbi:14550_t:CDS:1, partial [Gigaspora margarita]
ALDASGPKIVEIFEENDREDREPNFLMLERMHCFYNDQEFDTSKYSF